MKLARCLQFAHCCSVGLALGAGGRQACCLGARWALGSPGCGAGPCWAQWTKVMKSEGCTAELLSGQEGWRACGCTCRGACMYVCSVYVYMVWLWCLCGVDGCSVCVCLSTGRSAGHRSLMPTQLPSCRQVSVCWHPEWGAVLDHLPKACPSELPSWLLCLEAGSGCGCGTRLRGISCGH